MARYCIVDAETLDNNMSSVATAIRSKTLKANMLRWPTDFIADIMSLAPAKGECEIVQTPTPTSADYFISPVDLSSNNIAGFVAVPNLGGVDDAQYLHAGVKFGNTNKVLGRGLWYDCNWNIAGNRVSITGAAGGYKIPLNAPVSLIIFYK